MKQVWDDNLNKYVDVPEYKMVITLDIPDEVVSENNIPGWTYHSVKMSKVTLDYPSKERRDEAYESTMDNFSRRDIVHLVELQDRAIITSHIVMIEKVDG